MKFVNVIVTLAIMMFLYSCSLGEKNMIIDNDKEIANTKFDEILNAIESENKDTIISLFSKNCKKHIEEPETSIRILFEYFNGEVKSYNDFGGPLVETTKEGKDIIQIIEATYDVKTTVCEYRFAIRYIVKDTINSDNVGIQSLYVIKMIDDIRLENAYWGDGKFTPGIHIGIPNAEY